jgi:hypothetical protein
MKTIKQKQNPKIYCVHTNHSDFLFGHNNIFALGKARHSMGGGGRQRWGIFCSGQCVPIEFPSMIRDLGSNQVPNSITLLKVEPPYTYKL